MIFFPFLSPVCSRTVMSSDASKRTGYTIRKQRPALYCGGNYLRPGCTHPVSMAFPCHLLQQKTQLTGGTTQSCLCNGDLTLVSLTAEEESSCHFLVCSQYQDRSISLIYSYCFLSLTPYYIQSFTTQSKLNPQSISEIYLPLSLSVT